MPPSLWDPTDAGAELEPGHGGDRQPAQLPASFSASAHEFRQMS